MTRKGIYVRALALCASVLLTGLLPGSTVLSSVPAPGQDSADAAQKPINYFGLTKPHKQAAATAEEPLQPVRVALTVNKGDTLMSLLAKAQVPRGEAHEAVEALRDVYNPRDLLPGTNIELSFQPNENGEGDRSFLGLNFEPNVERLVSVVKTWTGFEAGEVQKPLKRQTVKAAGTITSSLYQDAAKAGVPAAIIVEMIRALSYDVDFQRDIQPNDTFAVMFDRMIDQDGRTARIGDMGYAELTHGSVTHRIYRFVTPDGIADYYNGKGESIRKALLRTPIDGARLTSGFGTRIHPILGYSLAHKGVDFGAPTGTPIMAAGSGTVVEAGWKGSYGRYVKIRHNGTYSTAYAHMSQIARTTVPGARVQQGQVIGYVGATGNATGPHLHYEVIADNAQVNPLGVKLPTGTKLEGKMLTAFQIEKGKLETRVADMPVAASTKVADKGK
ncbi:MAG TPA: peptidoglycan DD-metalloendopeptidase family protein [Alphaproteobacteria bacterium]|jgi:murein DD-endopeptidase MepM/ murein hydrolase activator NlpD